MMYMNNFRSLIDLSPQCDYGCLSAEETCGAHQEVGPCDIDCQNYCEDHCEGACQVECQVTCEHSCQCTVQSCQSCEACQTGCETSCQCSTQGCEDCLGCQSLCEIIGQSGCDYGCLTAAETCGTQQGSDPCTTTCQNYCESHCQTTCEAACQNGESGGYEDPINYEPEVLRMTAFFGSAGVQKGTGNYSETAIDMSVETPGFKLNFSRSYNSKDTRDQRLLGKGWTFGFEGTIKVDGTTVVRLPNGSSMTFSKTQSDVFTAVDSRSSLVKEGDGTYTLTTPDQYKYTFNAEGLLKEMTDRNGNKISLHFDANQKIVQVSCLGNEVYTITYDGEGRISQITEENALPELKRIVSYGYTNGQLTQVTDPMGFHTFYEYDSQNFLNKVKDHYGQVIRSMTYDHSATDLSDKLIQLVDANGNVLSYSYDTANYVTTITDRNGRVTRTWYDDWNYPIKKQDPDGLITETTYQLIDNANKYGEIKSIKDKRGNVTTYERDGMGNITKITKPGGITEQFAYDSKNNKILEINALGYRTEYIYDAARILLMKKVQPLNGFTVYTGVDDPALFAVTSYEYHTPDNQVPYGGLVKKEISPEGNIKEYTYDGRGNVVTEKDPQTGFIKSFEYNQMDLVTAEISAEGIRRETVYTKNRLPYKHILKDVDGNVAAVSIKVYDHMGRVLRQVDPAQYDSAADMGINQYSEDHGLRSIYSPSGLLLEQRDALSQLTSYTYDDYGNIKTKTLPNGAIYEYSYDLVNRMTAMRFKENSGANPQTLEAWEYSENTGVSIVSHKVFLNDSEQAITLRHFDFENKLIKEIYPDGGIISTTYYPTGELKEITDQMGYVTRFEYDAFGRQTAQWKPGDLVEGTVKYTWSGTQYDKDGRKVKELSSKEWVNLGETPATVFETSHSYLKNNLLEKTTYPNGGSVQYTYDKDGRVIETATKLSTSDSKVVSMVYDAAGNNIKKTEYVEKGSLAGYDYELTELVPLVREYGYDKANRLIKETMENGQYKEYSYDALGRKTSEWENGYDENGISKIIRSNFDYTWDGKLKLLQDPLGNYSQYNYNARGLLETSIDAQGGMKLLAYDLAGRLIREVSPIQYRASKTIEEMDHLYYIYDKMGRNTLVQCNVTESQWLEAAGSWSSTRVSYVKEAFLYDLLGRMTKKVDAEQYAAAADTGSGKVVNAKGTVWTYGPNGLAKTMLTPADAQKGLAITMKYSYDALGRKLLEESAYGQQLCFEYDSMGSLLKRSYKAKSTDMPIVLETNTYDLLGQLLSRTDANGHTTGYSYTQKGQLKTVSLPGDEAVAAMKQYYQYNMKGLLVRQWDEFGSIETYEYDHADRLTKKTRNNEAETAELTTQMLYDLNGRLAIAIDPMGNEALNTYDKVGRLLSTRTTLKTAGREDLPKIVSYTYDLSGNLVTSTDWLGNQWSMVYDSLGRLLEKISPLGESVEKHHYNRCGSEVTTYDGLGGKVIYQYDANQRVIITTDQEGKTTYQDYDAMNHVISKKDGKGNTSLYEFDGLGRLIKVTDALGQEAHYQYDGEGNMTLQLDSGGKTTTYVYGARNLLRKRIEHGGIVNGQEIDGLVTRFEYYKNGLLRLETDREGSQTAYEYDIHGRMTKRTKVDEAYSFTYDHNGNVLAVTDIFNPAASAVNETRSYDSENRLISETRIMNQVSLGTTQWFYDLTAEEGIEIAAGEFMTKTVDCKNKALIRVFDKLGRLKKLIEPALSNETTTYTYDANGNQKCKQYQSGAKTEYSYYKNNLVKEVKSYKADGSLLEQFAYTYDNANNQLSKTDVKGQTSYQYDALNRLKQVAEPDGRVTVYSFDAAGNRITEQITKGADTVRTYYAYNALNQLTEMSKYRVDTEPPTVAISPAGKLSNVPVTVTMTSNDVAASIYYTTDGSIPSASNGTKYTTAFSIDSTKTVMAVAIDPAGNASTVAAETYTIDSVAPVVSITPGSCSFGSTVAVTLTTNEANSSIYYTTNGTTPTATNGVKYTAPFSISTTTTLMAVAIDQAGNSSAVSTAIYTLDNVAPTVSITPGSCSFGSTITVTITTNESNTSIYYTTNGTTPTTTNGVKYTAPFSISSTTTLKAVAIDQVGNNSAVASASYTYDQCLVTCQSACQSSCQYSCEYSCQSACEVGCMSGCQISCMTGCQVSCQSSCETSCQTGCQVSCQSGCQVSCQCATQGCQTCQSGCQVSCQSCQGTCQQLCQIMVQCTKAEIVPDFDSEFTSPGYDVLSVRNQLRAEMQMSEAPTGSIILESTVFTYDTKGNTLSETKTTYNPDTQAVTGTESKEFEWTKGNLLKKSIVDNQVTRYRYNAAGQRIEKINHDNAPTRYLYEGTHIMLELDINGNQVAKNIRGLSLVKRTVTGKQLYYFNNAHGDVTTLLSGNGAISGKYYYDSFGNLTEEVDGQGNPYKYAGYEHDSETGLYYLKARYYSPKSARFISEDSYRGDRNDPLSLNLYTYCHNEPIMYWDPSGHIAMAMLMPGDDIGGPTTNTNSQVLKSGDSGDDVKLLQQTLVSAGFKIAVDGVYGNETKNAVKEFQAKQGLIADGVVGVNTIYSLYTETYNYTVNAANPITASLVTAMSTSNINTTTTPQVNPHPPKESHIVDSNKGQSAPKVIPSQVKPVIVNAPSATTGLGNSSNKGTGNGDSELGVLSAKYESNGNPGVIANNSGDPGGKSYGAWQLASKVGSVDAFLNWLKGVNYDYYHKLITAKQKDGNTFGNTFDNAWKQLAKDDRAGFLDVQHGYIKHAYYDVAAQKLKNKYGFDISTKSFALQNVLWSTAVQHGVGGAVSIFAVTGLTGEDEQIINEVYNERQKVDVHFKSCSPDVKKSVYNRFTNERKDALNMLKWQ